MIAPSTDGITLVMTEAVMFPLSLDPAPEGLTPTFSMFGGSSCRGEAPLVFTADYFSKGQDRILINLFAEDPRGATDSGWVFGERPTDRRSSPGRRQSGAGTATSTGAPGRSLGAGAGRGAYGELGARPDHGLARGPPAAARPPVPGWPPPAGR